MEKKFQVLVATLSPKSSWQKQLRSKLNHAANYVIDDGPFWNSLTLFGSQTPKKLLANCFEKLAGPALLVTVVEEVGWCFKLKSNTGKNVTHRLWHPFESQYLLSSENAREHACEFWTDHDLDDVAGIDRSNDELAFLWDAQEEKRLRQENSNAKKDRLVQRGILNELQQMDCTLPEPIFEKLLNRTQPHLVYKGFFEWQKKQLAESLKVLEISYKPNELKQLFDPNHWTTAEHYEMGNLPHLLALFGFDSTLSLPNDADTDETATGSDPWQKLTNHRRIAAEQNLRATNQLKMVDCTRPVKVPLTQIDLVAQIPMLIRLPADPLIGIRLPNGEPLDEDRIDHAEIVWHGNQSWIVPFDGILREDQPVQTQSPRLKKTGRVPFLDYLAHLPTGAEIDLRIHCADSSLATMRMYGRVKSGNWVIDQINAGIDEKDVKNAIKLFAKVNGKTEYQARNKAQIEKLQEMVESYSDFKEYAKPKFEGKTMNWRSIGTFYAITAIYLLEMQGTSLDATDDRQQSEDEQAAFWEEIAELDRQLNAGHKSKRLGPILFKSGSIKVHSMENKHVPKHFRSAFEDTKQQLDDLGFKHVGNLVCDKMGTAVVFCFAGPNDMHAHLLCSSMLSKAEFWTRFQSDDILTTINGHRDFCRPKKGLYYRSYSQRPLADLQNRHTAGIKQLAKAKQTKPIIHTEDLSDIASHLGYVIKKLV